MAVLPARVLFGAAYYHEYRPSYGTARPAERLKADLDLMAEARFTVIRVGESVWSTWEPENGRFELDWLRPVSDVAHERGISVVLGTPTYAVPPWPARQYPEITGERRTGERIGWGARQEVDSPTPRSASTPSGSSARSSAGTRTVPRSSASRWTTNPARNSCTTTASSSVSWTICGTSTATSRP